VTLLQQAGAAVLLVLVTLLLQCGGAAALIIWIRSIPRESREVRVFRCAALVMQTTLFCYGQVAIAGFACRRGNLPFTSLQAAMQLWGTAMWSSPQSGDCWARLRVWSAC
jgi:hypothetical protein